MINNSVGCTLAGYFLPMQLIITESTKKWLPKVHSSSNWDITCTANYWSNKITMLKNMDHIIIPYNSIMVQTLSQTPNLRYL